MRDVTIVERVTSHRTRWRGHWGWTVAAAMALSAVTGGCGAPKPSGHGGGPMGRGGPPPRVIVAPVSLHNVNPPDRYVGHVEAIEAVDLRARVEGFLEKVTFDEGAFVHAGEVLYVIEQPPYEAKVAQAAARVAAARAAVVRTTQYLDRLKAVTTGGVSATDLDDATADAARARAELDDAKAALKLAKLDLSYTTITAPISGRIGTTAYTRGNLVGPSSQPLARIVQIDPIRVVYSINENDLPAIQAALRDAAHGRKNPMLTPRLELPNGELYGRSGYIQYVDNQVDARTGTIAVRAVFPNPGGVLLPGQYTTVLVSRTAPRLLPAVPQTAIGEDRQGSYVLVVGTDKRVEARRIQLGPLVGNLQAVTSGLSKGDRVIVQGMQKVRPGQTVIPVSPSGAGGR
ncbi:MAG: efflux RND transporter periplasmic adaptor subunit [Acidobacteria bacterium]|nr:efflux RND transporter periplasmic adaptor subunit [Acidobacteriota bacterium]